MQRPVTPKIVKPRKPVLDFKWIVAVDDECVFVERTGEVHERSALPALVATEPSSLVVAHNVGIVVRELDELYSHLPIWNFRAMPIEREIWRPNRERRTMVRDTVIAWFGFKDLHKPGKTAGRYHYPLDPIVFSKATAHDLIPGDEPTAMKLFRWADQLRAWMLKQQIPMKPTHGGVAALLLKDSRFYPEARRKVPRATNDKAREQLPGNYYRLRVPTWKEYDAIYLDQSNSHHSCAAALSLPCANGLYGNGRFRDPLSVDARPYARFGTRLFDKAIARHGLFYLKLNNRQFGKDEFPLPCQEKPGAVSAFVYSNEIPYLLETGTHIEAIVASWTSAQVDTGLPAYAEWSLEELAEHPDYRKWLKPCLLATYGALAGRPRKVEIGHRRAKGGTDTAYPVGGSLIPVKAKRTKGESEAIVANVIQRGMIEAETRLRSVKMAGYMTGHGFEVLAVYADSVFVSAGQTIPFLPEGWKVEAALTRLRFYNDVSFESDQVTKLPGISRDDRLKRDVVERFKSGALRK